MKIDTVKYKEECSLPNEYIPYFLEALDTTGLHHKNNDAIADFVAVSNDFATDSCRRCAERTGAITVNYLHGGSLKWSLFLCSDCAEDLKEKCREEMAENPDEYLGDLL